MRTCRTPRPSLYFGRRGLPLMSIGALPLKNCTLIYICFRQTHSASVCRKLLEKRQTEPLVAGAYGTPSALNDIGRHCLPAMSELTVPRQFEFAAKIFCGQTHAPTSVRQISHCCYAQCFVKSSPPVVTLPAPASFPSVPAFTLAAHAFHRCPNLHSHSRGVHPFLYDVDRHMPPRSLAI